MPHLVEVAFKGNRKEFFAWSGDDPPAARLPVIVEGDRGEDLGHVHSTGAHAATRYAGVAHGALATAPDGTPAPAEPAPTRRVLRAATADDVRRAAEHPALDEEARRAAAERVRAHRLAMKLTDAEWQWDRRKLTLYFTAEKRVDFRGLVRDLAGLFRARIELKQIGVRDEAKRLSGVGRCGREYCSATWLPELRPVNLTVAKDQRLSLNPMQISGACGRLMCSLRYEHDFYVQQRKRFPKEGRILATARGEEKVISSDIFRERVTLRAPDGETRVVALAELRAETAAAAASTAADAEPDAGSSYGHSAEAEEAVRGGVPEPVVDGDASSTRVDARAGAAVTATTLPTNAATSADLPDNVPIGVGGGEAGEIAEDTAADQTDDGPPRAGPPREDVRRRGRRGGRRGGRPPRGPA